MMPLEFYRNIPGKECCQCGAQITEQHESYHTECERCLSKVEE
ncbi:protein YhfH [Domibacillus sp. 8LH]|nr:MULTISPECIES: protein YhfH [Domibacillus]MCI2252958.1 YhfH family protein [Domibacillus sp. PGB-M46]MCM3787377.1 YhfH family protein [Domibacillus indicus]WNS81343.1 protein YhfH [Domibacillus sp. DTU_2020_1001157_1_SI_ALB_TIR_016]